MDVGGFRVYRRDARSFQPGKWLTNEIINTAVWLWLYRPRANVVALNTFFMSTLCSTLGAHTG